MKLNALIFGLITILAVSCGDSDSSKKDGNSFLDGKTPTQAADALAGFYKMNKIKDRKPVKDKFEKNKFFMITPDLSFWALAKFDDEFVRDYEGSLYDHEFSFDENVFKSGSYRGEKMALNKESPTQFRRLAKIFSASTALIAEAEENGISIEVVARQQNLSFSDTQLDYIKALKGNIKAMKDRLADQGIKKIEVFEINDFPNKELSVKSKWLNIPAGIVYDKKEFKQSLSPDSKGFSVRQL